MIRLASRVCFVALFVLSWTSLVQADLNKGVVAAWTFDDGKVTDAIGQNHGKLFKGAAIKKKEDTHRMAESNKAFAHFRW